jgi:hypothetical protein
MPLSEETASDVTDCGTVQESLALAARQGHPRSVVVLARPCVSRSLRKEEKKKKKKKIICQAEPPVTP